MAVWLASFPDGAVRTWTTPRVRLRCGKPPWFRELVDGIGDQTDEYGTDCTAIIGLVLLQLSLFVVGPLTPFGREETFLWEYLMKPADAYTTQITEVVPRSNLKNREARAPANLFLPSHRGYRFGMMKMFLWLL